MAKQSQRNQPRQGANGVQNTHNSLDTHNNQSTPPSNEKQSKTSPTNTKKDEDMLSKDAFKAATHYESHIKCRIFVYTFLLLSVIATCEYFLFIYVYFPFWIYPIQVILNIAFVWLVTNKLLLSSIIFPYSSKIVINQVTRQLNEKYCEELTNLTTTIQLVIKEHLIKEESQKIEHSEYRDSNTKFENLINFFEKFAPANLELIKDNKEKLKKGKRTRRWKYSKLFDECTDIMNQMLDIFKTVKIQPCNSKGTFTIFDYYRTLNDFDRQNYDSKNVSNTEGCYFFEKRMPNAVSKEDRESLQKLDGLMKRFLDILKVSPSSIPIPRFLRCCCCKKFDRTSLGLFYKQLFGEVKQLGIVLRQQQDGMHMWIKTKGAKLDCMLFKRPVPYGGLVPDDDDSYKSAPTFILCNSNAMFYQQMVHFSHNSYLKYFLEKGFNVMTWNYRGYGRSSGQISPHTLQNDIETIYKYLRKELGITGKIGIYGRSLGGVSASYLANQVDMAIIDRSFCNFKDMAKYKYHGPVASALLLIGSCGWQVTSDFVVSKPSNCYKIIMQDKADEIVDIHASVMTGVANELTKQKMLTHKSQGAKRMHPILNNKFCKNFIDRIAELMDLEYALFFLMRKYIDDDFKDHHTLSSLIMQGQRQHSKMQMKQSNQKTGSNRYERYRINQPDDNAAAAVDLESGSARSSTHQDKKKSQPKKPDFEDKHHLKVIKQKILTNKKDQFSDLSSSVMTYNFLTLQISLSKITNKLESLCGGIQYLQEIFNTNQKPTVSQLQNFFVVQEVWGAHGEKQANDLQKILIIQEDKVPIPGEFPELEKLHEEARLSAYESLQNVNAQIETSLSEIQGLDQMKGVQKLLTQIKADFSQICDYWATKWQKNKKKEQVAVFTNKEPSFRQLGHLVPLQCGHNGKLERMEVAIVSMHLELAGMLPIEETISFRKGSIDDVPVSTTKKEESVAHKNSYQDSGLGPSPRGQLAPFKAEQKEPAVKKEGDEIAESIESSNSSIQIDKISIEIQEENCSEHTSERVQKNEVYNSSQQPKKVTSSTHNVSQAGCSGSFKL